VPWRPPGLLRILRRQINVPSSPTVVVKTFSSRRNANVKKLGLGIDARIDERQMTKGQFFRGRVG
jgi:hypothetical protein